MSPCQPRRVPVGNTISARWRVSVNNSRSLSELDLFLEIVDPKGFSFPLDFSVVADDIISFVYEGQLQELPGVYLVNLFERRGLTSQARLDRAAFELVRHTCEATPFVAPDNLVIDYGIELEDSALAVFVGSPYIINGYWYIDGVSLGVPAYMLPCGAYDPDREYTFLNSVVSGGSYYVCIQPCRGVPTTDTQYWSLVVSKGEKGEPGKKGDPGEKGDSGIPTISAVGSAVSSLTCQPGVYFRLDVAVETLAVNLPSVQSNETHVQNVVLYLTAGNSPAVTFTAVDGKPVYYADGFKIEAGETYEINALCNGLNWVLASLKIKTS